MGSVFLDGPLTGWQSGITLGEQRGEGRRVYWLSTRIKDGTRKTSGHTEQQSALVFLPTGGGGTSSAHFSAAASSSINTALRKMQKLTVVLGFGCIVVLHYCLFILHQNH
jgi:hypothetical protein